MQTCLLFIFFLSCKPWGRGSAGMSAKSSYLGLRTLFCLGRERSRLPHPFSCQQTSAPLQVCTSKQESGLPPPEEVRCKGCCTAGVAIANPLQQSADSTY